MGVKSIPIVSESGAALMNVLATAVITPEALLAMPDGKRFELVDGELVETNVSTPSSWVGGESYRRIANFVIDNRLGTVWPADCGLQCFADDPGRVRRPDAMFISAERYPIGRLSEGFLRDVPDLVVEVISTNDTARSVERKIEEYLNAGIRRVWVISPETRTVRIERGDGTSSRLRHEDELMGEDVIPGFVCKIAELFPTEAVVTGQSTPQVPAGSDMPT